MSPNQPIPPELAASQCDDSYAEIAKFLEWYDQNAKDEDEHLPANQ